ncbi:MAG TPA: HAD family hydrolase [Thermoplasmata archaeon]|nr:HAD family hydrolase [Thermoplasmata archaeon]
MPDGRRFRGVSLDLWYTTISHAPGEQDRWQAARARIAGELLTGPTHAPVGPEAAAGALRTVEEELAGSGRSMSVVDPLEVLRRAGHHLGANLAGDPEQAGARFSAAGLDEVPPTINPEALRLCRALEELDVPVIAITNTGRRGASWADAFRRLGGPRFRAVVTSCELGVAKPDPMIFAAGARCLGVAPAEVLHVGDRWDLDVEGARRAGMGAALYGGLWDRYAIDEYAAADGPFGPRGREGLPPDVAYVERLDELLERYVWAPGHARGRR